MIAVFDGNTYVNIDMLYHIGIISTNLWVWSLFFRTKEQEKKESYRTLHNQRSSKFLANVKSPGDSRHDKAFGCNYVIIQG